MYKITQLRKKETQENHIILETTTTFTVGKGSVIENLRDSQAFCP